MSGKPIYSRDHRQIVCGVTSMAKYHASSHVDNRAEWNQSRKSFDRMTTLRSGGAEGIEELRGQTVQGIADVKHLDLGSSRNNVKATLR